MTTTGGATPVAATQQSAPARNGSAASPTVAKGGRGGGTAASATGASPGLSRTAAHVDEQVVFAADAGTPFTISPRGQHVAGRTLKGSRTVMVYDGVAGPPFDEIPGTGLGGAFSDDGNHYAYVARQGQQWVVMEDGKEVARGGPFFQTSGTATMESIAFTPGGKHLYFTIADIEHNKFQFYFDGKPDPVIQDHVLPVISPDGEHYAYVFSANKETGHPLPALDGRWQARSVCRWRRRGSPPTDCTSIRRCRCREWGRSTFCSTESHSCEFLASCSTSHRRLGDAGHRVGGRSEHGAERLSHDRQQACAEQRLPRRRRDQRRVLQRRHEALGRAMPGL